MINIHVKTSDETFNLLKENTAMAKPWHEMKEKLDCQKKKKKKNSHVLLNGHR